MRLIVEAEIRGRLHFKTASIHQLIPYLSPRPVEIELLHFLCCLRTSIEREPLGGELSIRRHGISRREDLQSPGAVSKPYAQPREPLGA